jgi:hypothetical protein
LGSRQLIHSSKQRFMYHLIMKGAIGPLVDSYNNHQSI